MSLLLTFEGPDGSGKSLQIDLLAKALEENGRKVLVSREPGGTPVGEAIRSLLLDPANKDMDPVTEAYLYAASRAQHVRQKIKPALEEGTIVLLDRFLDSSLIYQGIGRGLGIGTVEEINRIALGSLTPDLTFMVYIDYEEGLRRKEKQENHPLDRLEQEKASFHKMVCEGCLQLAKLYPERIRLIDGSRSPGLVHQDIWKITNDLLLKKNL